MLLGRLALYLKSHEHLLIPPQRITVVFVASDISTFLVQAAGALLAISKNLKLAKTGEHVSLPSPSGARVVALTRHTQIFLAGLALQLASFAVFVLLALRFLYRIRTIDPQVWAVDAAQPWHRDWRTLALVLIVSSIGILVSPSFPHAHVP